MIISIKTSPKACFYFIDGFCKDEIMEKILEFLYKITPEEMPATAHDFLKNKLPYGEIDLIKTEAEFVFTLPKKK